jgi:hypothetical protein
LPASRRNTPEANLLPLEQMPAGWLLESFGEDDHAHRWFCRISDKKFITIGYGKHARAAMLDRRGPCCGAGSLQ